MTVADLLDELGDPYPYAVVRMAGRLVSRPDFRRTMVPHDSELFLLPLVAGG
jgi:sulfur carrier protein ThiS